MACIMRGANHRSCDMNAVYYILNRLNFTLYQKIVTCVIFRGIVPYLQQHHRVFQNVGSRCFFLQDKILILKLYL